jgi:hypothetical protein
MTKEMLRALVFEAVSLDRKIAAEAEVLKQMKKRLIAEAQSRPEELIRIADGGKSLAFESHDGCVARVTFPKPTLKANIDGEGLLIEKLRTLACPHFAALFSQAPSYVPTPGFRESAEKMLGKEDAAALIKLCTSKSTPRVSFETKPAEDLKQ